MTRISRGVVHLRDLFIRPKINLAMVNLFIGRFENARQLLLPVIATARNSSNFVCLVDGLANLAWCALLQGSYDEATSLAFDGLATIEKVSELTKTDAKASFILMLGHLEMCRGNIDKAETFIERSIDEAKRASTQFLQAARAAYGRVLLMKGELSKARAVLEKTLEQNPRPFDRIMALQNLGVIEAREGRRLYSEQCFGEALRLVNHSFGMIASPLFEAQTRYFHGESLIVLHDYDSAVEEFKISLRLAKKCKYIEFIGLANLGMAQCMKAENRIALALVHAKEATNCFEILHHGYLKKARDFLSNCV
jgi:tetratricopeptide (TPR) repeat protein